MDTELLPVDHLVERAVLECIVERGINNVHLEDVAERLGASRAALCRTYGSWHGLLAFTHRHATRALNHCDDGSDCEFEQWWAAMLQRLRSPMGRAYRALRGVVAGGRPMDQLELEEVGLIRAFEYWIRLRESDPTRVAVLAQSVWLLILTAAGRVEASPEERQLLDLARVILLFV